MFLLQFEYHHKSDCQQPVQRETPGDVNERNAVHAVAVYTMALDLRNEPNVDFLTLFEERNESLSTEVIKVLKAVATAIRNEYGNDDIAISLIKYVFENGMHDEDGSFIEEELQQEAGDSLFVDHLAEEFPNLFETDDQKQILQSLFSTALNTKRSASSFLKNSNFIWTLTRKQSENARHFLTVHCPGMIIDDKDVGLVDVVAIGSKNSMHRIRISLSKLYLVLMSCSVIALCWNRNTVTQLAMRYILPV